MARKPVVLKKVIVDRETDEQGRPPTPEPLRPLEADPMPAGSSRHDAYESERPRYIDPEPYDPDGAYGDYDTELFGSYDEEPKRRLFPKREPRQHRPHYRLQPGLAARIVRWLFGVSLLAFALLLIFERFLNIIVLAVVLVLLYGLYHLFVRFWMRPHHAWSRWLCLGLASVLTLTFGMGAYDLYRVNSFLSAISATSTTKRRGVGLYAQRVNHFSAGNTSGKTVAVPDNEVYLSLAEQLAPGATLIPTDSSVSAASMLMNGQTDFALVPNARLGDIHRTPGLYEFVYDAEKLASRYYEEERDQSGLNPSDPPGLGGTQLILFSGSDEYGELDEPSRSDMVMLLAWSPRTGKLLTVSLPRDTYVTISCRKAAGVCVPGSQDKLTHASLGGMDVYESTVEDLLGAEINYTVRLNFSALTDLVDALGGIDVYVEPGLAVEHLYVNPALSVKEGWNHLDGATALAFSRERKAYAAGDLQRIQNQQQVYSAIFKKLASPMTLFRLPAIMDVLSSSVQTNMSPSQIRGFVRSVSGHIIGLRTEKEALNGSSATGWSEAAQADASVTIVDEAQLQQVRDTLQAMGVPAPAAYSPEEGSLFDSIDLDSIWEGAKDLWNQYTNPQEPQ